jgi:hypothetical protein
MWLLLASLTPDSLVNTLPYILGVVKVPEWGPEYDEGRSWVVVLVAVLLEGFFVLKDNAQDKVVDQVWLASDQSIKEKLQTLEAFDIVCKLCQQPWGSENHELKIAIICY